jgi:hypothetical protein
MFAEVTKPTTLSFYHRDKNEPVMADYEIPAGTTVKIVMWLHLGDVGITDDLEADYGYWARVSLSELKNVRNIRNKVHSAAGSPILRKQFFRIYPCLLDLWKARTPEEIAIAKQSLSPFIRQI